jgi:PadR family transcriptional regulator, regulatory protein PadR
MRPLSEAEFQILLALADAPRHGYGIIKEVEGRTDGALRLGAGTLYGAIRRFVDSGLVVEREDDSEEDGRRRVYALTKLGRRAAADEAARLERLVVFARSKKLLRG